MLKAIMAGLHSEFEDSQACKAKTDSKQKQIQKNPQDQYNNIKRI